MSRPEITRRDESAEDAALRQELRGLLAMDEAPAPPRPTPDMIALADSLLREAERRRHTPNVRPLRRRPTALLMAAGLPLVLGLVGMGAYGISQKRKAEAMAAAVQVKEQENRRLRESHQQERERERLLLQSQQVQMATAKPTPTPARKGPKGQELVLPVQRPAAQGQVPETLQVKERIP